ncbi:Anaphase-promoting complex subunit 13 [Camponotus japonicus]
MLNVLTVDMDSQVCGDGRLIDVIDESWRKERLPIDDISTPVAELPDPESDNGDSHMTLKELEQKWNNLALSSLSDNHLHSPTPLHN